MKARFFLFLVLFFVLCSLSVLGQPVPGHRIYGFVSDATGWGIVGARVTVVGNVSGVVWEGVSREGGYFNSGYMSYVREGELLTASSCWLGECVNVSRPGLGARSLFELSVPVVVDRPRHRQGVPNVSVLVSGVVGRLGGFSEVVVFVENVGDFRLVGVNVSLVGVPVGWNVSGLGLLDLSVGEGGGVSFRVFVPVGAVVGGYNFSALVLFEGGVVEVPFSFVVEGACASDVECGLGFVCVGGVCEVDRRCFNGVRDHGEVGVDCGGPCVSCVVSTVPRPPLTTLPSVTTLFKSTSTVSFLGSCFNGVLDVGEVGVDCGGVCATPCVGGRSVWALFGGLGVLLLFFVLFAVLVFLWVRRKKE